MLAIKLIRGMAEVYPNFHAQDKSTQVRSSLYFLKICKAESFYTVHMWLVLLLVHTWISSSFEKMFHAIGSLID